MTDVEAGAPAGPMPLGPPAPELDTAAPEEAAAPAETPDQAPAIGPLRQAILDALTDADEPLSVARILEHLPIGTTRNTAESAIKRAYDAGEIVRTSPGHYALAPPEPKPARPPAPPPEPAPAPGEVTDQQWFDALESWLADASTWPMEALRPPPDHADTRVPPPIKLRFADRVRKRIERAKDRAAALATQAKAADKLRAELLSACRHGRFDNSTPALVAEDLRPIKALLQLGVPIGTITVAIMWRTDNDRLTTWRDEKFLRKAWEYFGRFDIIPDLLRMSKTAETAPGKPAGASDASPAAQGSRGPGKCTSAVPAARRRPFRR